MSSVGAKIIPVLSLISPPVSSFFTRAFFSSLGSTPTTLPHLRTTGPRTHSSLWLVRRPSRGTYPGQPAECPRLPASGRPRKGTYPGRRTDTRGLVLDGLKGKKDTSAVPSPPQVSKGRLLWGLGTYGPPPPHPPRLHPLATPGLAPSRPLSSAGVHRRYVPCMCSARTLRVPTRFVQAARDTVRSRRRYVPTFQMGRDDFQCLSLPPSFSLPTDHGSKYSAA